MNALLVATGWNLKKMMEKLKQELLHQYLFFAQCLAMWVGCPLLERNTSCSALVRVGLCATRTSSDFLAVVGFWFFCAVDKRTSKIKFVRSD
jgi:hypothetical protein